MEDLKRKQENHLRESRNFKCSKIAFSLKENAGKFSWYILCSTYICTILSACLEGMAKMHQVGSATGFWAKMGANSAARIGHTRLPAKTGSARKLRMLQV